MPSVWPKGRKSIEKIDDLTFDPELQVRAAGEEDWHAEQLSEAVKKGDQLPQVQVIHVKEGEKAGMHVIDGRHTCKAAKMAGKKTVVCNVRPGTWEDAVLEASKANRHHDALKLRPADKRRAVLMVLSVEPHWSNKRVAAHLGTVSDRFVADVRGDRPAAVVGKDGKTHKLPAKKPTDSTAGWRSVPLVEFLKCSNAVQAQIDKKGLTTAGDLYDCLRANAMPVKPSDAADLMDELRALDPAVPRPEPAKEAKPQQGAAAFDWADFDEPFGRCVRAIDRRAKDATAPPDSLDAAAAKRLLAELADLTKKWAKRDRSKK